MAVAAAKWPFTWPFPSPPLRNHRRGRWCLASQRRVSLPTPAFRLNDEDISSPVAYDRLALERFWCWMLANMAIFAPASKSTVAQSSNATNGTHANRPASPSLSSEREFGSDLSFNSHLPPLPPLPLSQVSEQVVNSEQPDEWFPSLIFCRYWSRSPRAAVVVVIVIVVLSLILPLVSTVAKTNQQTPGEFSGSTMVTVVLLVRLIKSRGKKGRSRLVWLEGRVNTREKGGPAKEGS